MIIDLHVHTRIYSRDSNLDPDEAIQQAKKIGLGGICFAEHNKAWDIERARQLSSKWNFPVLRGMEVDTTEGHVLVFGVHTDIDRIITMNELQELVQKVNGAMIAAHPFGGFFSSGLPDTQIIIERAMAKPVLQYVDAIEGLNGRSTERENNLARKVAEHLNLGVVGGSDAHEVDEIGRCVTVFANDISSEADLVAALKENNFKPSRLQN